MNVMAGEEMRTVDARRRHAGSYMDWHRNDACSIVAPATFGTSRSNARTFVAQAPRRAANRARGGAARRESWLAGSGRGMHVEGGGGSGSGSAVRSRADLVPARGGRKQLAWLAGRGVRMQAARACPRRPALGQSPAHQEQRVFGNVARIAQSRRRSRVERST
jgi:hypothetical protein